MGFGDCLTEEIITAMQSFNHAIKYSQSATKIWRSIDKARSIAEVQGVIKTRLRRILGITAVRSAQFLKTQRLSHLTGDFQRSRKRSAQARSFFEAWSSEYDTYFGPRSWRTRTAI